jgi:subtilisin-like proprotein convertase family protein
LQEEERAHLTTAAAPLLTFFCGEIKRASWKSSDAPKIISAQNGRTVSTLEIPASFKVAELEVQLEVRHEYLSDLILVLEAPSGARVTLSSRNGEGEDNFEATTFADKAASAITAGTAPYHGMFQPEEPLALLRGEDARGTWKLIVLDRVEWDDGSLESWGMTFSFVEETLTPTHAQETGATAPEQLKLYESYPNPFTPSRNASAANNSTQSTQTNATRIAFDLPAHASGEVTLRVYNTLGQLVRTLINRTLPAGKHEIAWDGKDEHGRIVAAGTYLYALQSGKFIEKKKLLISR